MGLPSILVGSYQRYKEDTALFTTWLAQAAAACGYKPQEAKLQTTTKPSQPMNATSIDPKPGGRLKGKDRKAAKDAAKAAALLSSSGGSVPKASNAATKKYTITTAELLRQAKVVAASKAPKIIIPVSLQHVLKRTIRARQRCTEWFQRSGVRNEHSDRQHIHFANILQQSLSVLVPDAASEAPDASSTHPPVKYTENLSPPPVLIDLTNRFNLLEVEENHDLDLSEIHEVVAASKAPKKTPLSTREAVVEEYEVESEDAAHDDLAFVIFCFFEDLHRIQDYIGDLWESYNRNVIDLQTAALVTNAALDLVRRAEEDILRIAPELFDKRRSWDTISIIIFYADAFEKGVCPETRMNTSDTLRITPFDDFIYLSVARVLMKFTYVSTAPEEALQGYPLPCPPMRFGYISRPELLKEPGMSEKEKEDRKLSEYIMDRQLWRTVKTLHAQMTNEDVTPPMDDEFGKCIDRLLSDGAITVATVFAARIYLDIQQSMQNEVSKGFQDLTDTANEIDRIMNLKVRAGAWDVAGSGERWHDKDTESVMRIKLTSMTWILQSPLPVLKQNLLKDVTFRGDPVGLDHEPSKGAEGRGFASAAVFSDQMPAQSDTCARDKKPIPPRNPHFSTVSMQIHSVPKGLSEAQTEETVRKELIESGRLSPDPSDDPRREEYEENARKLQLRPLDPSKDLDLIHRTNPIYCGLTAFNLLTDFEIAGINLINWHMTVWPVVHLYNALRQTKLLRDVWPEMEELFGLHMGELFSGQLPLSLEECHVRFALSLGISSTSFARNARQGHNDNIKFRKGVNGTKLKVNATSDTFRSYLDNKSSLDTCLAQLKILMKDPGRGASRKERAAAQSPLSSLQFLALLKANLPKVNRMLHFDYTTLSKQCTKILKDIREQLNLQLGISTPRQKTEDSVDHALPFLTYEILEESRSMQMPGPKLLLAEAILKTFLSTYKPDVLLRNFNALPRLPLAPSGLVPNTWNITIRHIPLPPAGDLVFFVQPETHFVHTEGPIQIAEGQLPGHTLNPKSKATLQTIAGLMMKAFVGGMGPSQPDGCRRPWKWTTSDQDFARRITKVMRDMGVQEEALLRMEVLGPEEMRSIEEDWGSFTRGLTGLLR